jgi:hypothetical protein
MLRRVRTTYLKGLTRTFGFILMGLLTSSYGLAGQRVKANLQPKWVTEYQVRTGASGGQNPNGSFLNNTQSSHLRDRFQDDVQGMVLDRNQALVWRQQLEDLNRDYEMRSRAGLSNQYLLQAHTGQVAGFNNSVLDSLERRTLEQSGNRATAIAIRNDVIRTAATPAVVVAGVYIGKPIPLRVGEESRFNLRTDFRNGVGSLEFLSPSGGQNSRLSLSTDFRNNVGAFEVSSPIASGNFIYRPAAPASRDYASSPGDIGTMMAMGNTVDFSQERYQLTVARGIPIFDLSSSLLYGSSSNAVAGSLSKSLTNNLTLVVDSIRLLTPYDASRSTEEKVRLRYDIRF